MKEAPYNGTKHPTRDAPTLTTRHRALFVHTLTEFPNLVWSTS